MDFRNEIAYIGLGSNLNNPAQQIQRALKWLSQIPHTRIFKVSSLYRSKALIPPERSHEKQPDYMNAVAAVETCLSPSQLLEHCQNIEQQMGRSRTRQRWEARIIDLDILLYGEQKIHTDSLKIPHPELSKRIFVVKPLAELNPALRLPDGREILGLLQDLRRDEGAIEEIGSLAHFCDPTNVAK